METMGRDGLLFARLEIFVRGIESISFSFVSLSQRLLVGIYCPGVRRTEPEIIKETGNGKGKKAKY